MTITKENMAILNCAHCNHGHKVDEARLISMKGRAAKCAKCGKSFIVSAPVESEPESPDAYDIATEEVKLDYAVPRAVPPARIVQVDTKKPSVGFGRSVQDFFAFRSMITVQIIQKLFLFGSLIYILVAAAWMAMTISKQKDSTAAIPIIFVGVIVTFFSLLAWRLTCEFLVVVFRINETLTEIKNQND